MEFKQVAMRSPRDPGVIVRIDVPVGFERYRDLDDAARLAVDVIDRKVGFSEYPLDALGFIAARMAARCETDFENKARANGMAQAIMAIRVPEKQPIVSQAALELMREIYPGVEHPTAAARA